MTKPKTTATASRASGRRTRSSPEKRLERLLLDRIADLERGSASADPETAAKALALNVRTLASLRRARPAPDDVIASAPPDRPIRTLSELRDELLGHLERIRDEERAARGCPENGADGGGE